ncbi:MKI67 FHA domain-interacting nucleolar phosphoprotein [Corythoichthys intestinalis]|uniref:MKI67 FHA domain-interacting nucleolar phosphoprotein n=1 Tax=Corythoichthys intestinalis TaxID=161448 RepID=UPI0025A5C418|nr:MKI67 FHA domain-interacting nucleolar phosphoprotein [Corythoichthys intestinalis]
MTESKGGESAKPAKELLSLNPEQEHAFKKKVQTVKKSKKDNRLTPGVIYVGHLPRRLCEPDLKAYFEQFGTVSRLRLSRSKKTGGSKGYAFVEFECDEVAKIVAETMNNYLMGEKLIQCHTVPPEKQHEKMFVGCNRTFRKPSKRAVFRYNMERSSKQVTKMTNKLLNREEKLRKRLAAKGIDYDFPGFAAHVSRKKKCDSLNESTCSDDTTPMCTPSFMERRKSTVNDDDADDEIIIKMPSVEKDECSSSEEEEDDEEEEEEKSDLEDEEQCKAD